MSDSLYISTSGAVSRLNQLDILAHNLANADTVGFKADQAVFQAVLASALLDASGQPAAGAAGMSFVETHEIRTHHGQGPISRTERNLDAALQGPGFFVVESPAGVRYTRAGSFIVRPDGLLATPDGYPVLGEGGTISAAERPVHLNAAAEVVDDRGVAIDRLRLETFEVPGLLEKEGGNLFRAPAAAVGLPVEDPRILPGALERSNVSPVRDLAALMILQRAFEASMQVLRADDEATQQLIQEMSQ